MTNRAPRARTTRPLTPVPDSPATSGPGRRARTVTEPGPVLGSLCTGYGGLDLGVLTALGGGRIAWVADPDPHVTKILDTRMPGTPNLGDLRTIDWTRVEPVDVLVAGFPCQDISAAGKRAGIEKGHRSGLWTDIMVGVRVLRPTYVVVENVAALRWKNGGLHRVLGDLAETGYDALWRSVRAADIGAPHRRERVFLLAWHRQLHDRRRGGGVADTDRARRLLQRHQRHHQTRQPVPTGPAPVAAVAHTDRGGLPFRGDPDRARTRPDDPGGVRDPDRLGPAPAHSNRVGCEELHPPHPDRWPLATRPSSAAADPASLGHRHRGTQSRTWIPATTVPTSTAAGHTGDAPTDTTRDGRHEGLPSPTRVQGRPDAALGRHPTPHPTTPPNPTEPDDDVTDPDLNQPAAEAPAELVNWGVYEAAIRRWEQHLDRPTPHPTQPGRHGRPVLAPAFVEHLMGLPTGWVTDLPLPRTAQLRALGNGVVPHQAAHAVTLLLDDLTALLHTAHHTEAEREVAA